MAADDRQEGKERGRKQENTYNCGSGAKKKKVTVVREGWREGSKQKAERKGEPKAGRKERGRKLGNIMVELAPWKKGTGVTRRKE